MRAGPERFSFRQGVLKRGERITVLTSRCAPPARPIARGRPRDSRRRWCSARVSEKQVQLNLVQEAMKTQIDEFTRLLANEDE